MNWRPHTPTSAGQGAAGAKGEAAMPDKQKKVKTPPPNYRVGDRVRFHFPSQTAEGVIVEYRGGLGVGGRRL